MSDFDPATRFDDRVQDYLRARPGYPQGLVPLLRREIGLVAEWIIADVGSGTGLSAEPFLRNGNRVIGVEPNVAMRRATESWLADWPGFTSREGTAENTGLAADSIDMIVAAQAFHWFQQAEARAEFKRVLHPGGWVVLLWNRRHTDTTPFLRAYEALLERYGTDYQQVRHDRLGSQDVTTLFGHPVEKHTLPNLQVLDADGLKGRLLSSSYTPSATDPRREPMLAGLTRIFNAHQHGGVVRMEYDTEIYMGRLHG